MLHMRHTFFCCTLHNNNVKSLHLRFSRQRERTNANLSFYVFTLKPLVEILLTPIVYGVNEMK